MRPSTPETRRLRRARVVSLREAGHSFSAIATQTGLSRTGVFNICKRIETMGKSALDDAPRVGRKGILSEMNATLLRALIAEHTPDQLSMAALLWTNSAVAQLIELRAGVRLSVRNTALTLTRWGFAPPRPLTKARTRDAPAAQRWLVDDYPGIVTRARIEGAELAWTDISRLPSSQVNANTAGETDDSHRPQEPRSRLTRSVFSTVDNRGRACWAAFDGSLDATVFIELLRRRIHHADRKVVLISDPMRLYRCAAVQAWLSEHEDDIEIVELPGE